MARGKLHPKMRERMWKKGQKSANPLGGKLMNPAIRALKNLSNETYREVIELALTSNLKGVEEYSENPSTSAIGVSVAKAVLKAAKHGDWHLVNAIAERLVGKVPDKIDISGSLAKSEPPTKEQLVQLLKEIKDDC